MKIGILKQTPLTDKPKLLILCGPTASGKSKIAIDFALKLDGEIVNADGVQIYKEIPILSCSPIHEDKEKVPHHLYNHIALGDNYSVQRYLEEALPIISDIADRKKIPIIVGGTGLYIKALSEGLNIIPDIPPVLRQEVRELFANLGNEKFHELLKSLDPLAASILHISNSQRLMRAYEIFLHTGKSIYEFHKTDTISPIANWDVKTIILNPKREILYSRCNMRFIEIVENGALDEVKALMGLIDPKKVKAIGFYELMEYLNGNITKAEAINIGQTKTRQYAKRQITWFKHQIKGDKEYIDDINHEFIFNSKN